MRIIDNPNPKEEKVLVCHECQCKFAYNSNDIHSWNNGIIGPGFAGDRWVNCPNCGQHLSLRDLGKKPDYNKFEPNDEAVQVVQVGDNIFEHIEEIHGKPV